MITRDVFRAGQIGNRPSHFQNAVAGAGSQITGSHHRIEQLPGRSSVSRNGLRHVALLLKISERMNRSRSTTPPHSLAPPRPCHGLEDRENFWGQLGTTKVRLSAFSCALRLIRRRNETRITGRIHAGSVTHRAQSRSAIAWLRVPRRQSERTNSIKSGTTNKTLEILMICQ